MKRYFLILVLLSGIFNVSLGQIVEKAEDISPLLIGERIPAVTVNSIDDIEESLVDIVKQKPSVVLFYRGGWCPYCNRHLAAVGLVEEKIAELGYQIIAISPDSPEKLKITAGKEELNYALYSDADGDLTMAMGLAFQAPERYNKRLNDYSAAKNPGLLPVPALFVVDTEGIILFEYISPNYRKRISAELLLAVLQSLDPSKD